MADGMKSENNRAADKPAPRELLAARGISKGFNSSGARIDILNNLSLDLVAGETLSVVGLRVSANRPCSIYWERWIGPTAAPCSSRERTCWRMMIPGWPDSEMNL